MSTIMLNLSKNTEAFESSFHVGIKNKVGSPRTSDSLDVEVRENGHGSIPSNAGNHALETINSIIFDHRGLALKELRKSVQLSLKELSELSGLSISFISSIESGERKPSDESLTKISTVLGVPVNYFDLMAMVLGKEKLSPTLQKTAQKIEPILSEILREIEKSKLK